MGRALPRRQWFCLTETMGTALGLEPTPSTAAQMAVYAKAEREKWAVVIRDSGIKLD